MQMIRRNLKYMLLGNAYWKDTLLVKKSKVYAAGKDENLN